MYRVEPGYVQLQTVLIRRTVSPIHARFPDLITNQRRAKSNSDPSLVGNLDSGLHKQKSGCVLPGTTVGAILVVVEKVLAWPLTRIGSLPR